ncbi:transposase [Rhizobium leguminosarum]|uniref:transposase n=1 Tax=Rhizobium leguminosarum TaxID=384 RepID=UPI001FDEA5BF|nr:transposase [Rhizobium leguminosarum]
MEEQVDQPGKGTHTAEEAIAAFRGLSNEDQRNIVATARACLAGTGFATPQELISEAYIRIAEGRRKWSEGKTFSQFLGGVLRSLATDGDFLPEERKLVRRNKGSAIVTSEHLDTISIENDDELAQKARDEEALTKLEERFAGDEEMELLLMGIRGELIGQDLQEFIGVDAKRLEALRTRLTRELKKLAAAYGAKEGRS